MHEDEEKTFLKLKLTPAEYELDKMYETWADEISVDIDIAILNEILSIQEENARRRP